MIGISVDIWSYSSTGGGGTTPDWILATGVWNDSGVWIDSATWID